VKRRKTMSSNAITIFVICLIVFEVLANQLFKSSNVLISGVIGGCACLVAYLVGRAIAWMLGVDIYTVSQDQGADRQGFEPQASPKRHVLDEFDEVPGGFDDL
jgi:hypothetical protein